MSFGRMSGLCLEDTMHSQIIWWWGGEDSQSRAEAPLCQKEQVEKVWGSVKDTARVPFFNFDAGMFD